MDSVDDRSRGDWRATLGARMTPVPAVASIVVCLLVWIVSVPASAQQSARSAQALVFDGATVVDVEQGKLVPDQRVVIVGNRIQAVGPASQVRMPPDVRLVDARGKYLIPGLWDLHTHPDYLAPGFFYPLFVANGVTGIRDAYSHVPLDTLRQWRGQILTGTRVGPPRQILSGSAINVQKNCGENVERELHGWMCVSSGDTAAARQLVQQLRATGADMLKLHQVLPAMYPVIAEEARRQGLPFGGHADQIPPLVASDYGARIVDHQVGPNDCGRGDAFVQCMQEAAERFRRNDTWLVPTLAWLGMSKASQHLRNVAAPAFWAGSLLHGNWLREPVDSALAQALADGARSDSSQGIAAMRRFGIPLLAGTDVINGHIITQPPGFGLHAELASYVLEGMTPLEALRAATLNPAKMLHGTDSLGTVAPGKLSDLVLLDADPLADITNTTTIRAVVANGRYYDRAALDRVLVEARASMSTVPMGELASAKKGTVLPVVSTRFVVRLADARYAAYRDSAAARAWADSMIGVLLAERAPQISWVLPSAIRALAKAGKVTDPAGYRQTLSYGKSLLMVADSLHPELRQLVAATGGRLVLMPVDLQFYPDPANNDPAKRKADGACATLWLQLVDGHTSQILWRNFGIGFLGGWSATPASGCGATPEAALAAAFAVAFPR